MALGTNVSAMEKTSVEFWKDPNLNEVNRLPMTTTFATDGLKLSLSGLWKFNFNKDLNTRPTDFYRDGYDDSQWGTIPVPGLWDLNGYCDPIYVNTPYPWDGHFRLYRTSTTMWDSIATTSFSVRSGRDRT